MAAAQIRWLELITDDSAKVRFDFSFFDIVHCSRTDLFPLSRLDGLRFESCFPSFGLSDAPPASILPVLFLTSIYRDHCFPTFLSPEHFDAGEMVMMVLAGLQGCPQSEVIARAYGSFRLICLASSV